MTKTFLKTIRIKHILPYLFYFSVTSIFSQEASHIKFENISINDGLSQSSANCILQDSKGLMWFGTEDGLNKYDGYTFTVYKPDKNNGNSISSPRIYSLYEDHEGNLWIGTNLGLNKYDKGLDRFTQYLPNDSCLGCISGLQINSIIETPDHTLWIGTDKGLNKLDKSNYHFQVYRSSNGNSNSLSNDYVKCIVPDKNGNLWIGTENGLNYFDTKKKTFTTYFHDNNLSSLVNNNVKSLLLSGDKVLWVGTVNGLDKFDIKNHIFKHYNYNLMVGNELSQYSATTLLLDKNNNLWVGTSGIGLSILPENQQEFVNYQFEPNNPYSLSNNEVLSTYMDNSGIIWVGTNGLDKYNPNKEKFTLYDYVPYTKEKLIYRNIHGIYEDAKNVLWICSKGDGVHILDRKNNVSKRLMFQPGNDLSLTSNKVRVVKEHPEGVFWFGTDDAGLNRVFMDENRNPVRVEHFMHHENDSNSLASNRIYSLYFDKEDMLWIGTDNGLDKLNTSTGNIKHYKPEADNPNSLSNLTAYSIYGDRSGNIWVATDEGINLYNPQTDGFIHYTHDPGNPKSINNNEILTIYEDDDETLWIGTYGSGLNHFNKETGEFEHFDQHKELATAVIYGILEDESKTLWLSSNNGIIKFNPQSGYIKQFTTQDGLQSNEFNGGSYFESQTGEMLFGGQYGFNSFFPEKVKLDSVPPKIILSDLKIKNESVFPGDDSPIKKSISEVNEIHLDAKQNNFTIYFSALHYADPEHNRYKYMLEGFDDNWIDAGNRRFASYTSLPYKHYTFKVIAANADDVWTKNGIAVKVIVSPPIWKTWWFITLFFLVIGYVAYYLFHDREKRIKKEQEKLKNELNAGENELQKQRDEILIQKQEIKIREKEDKDLKWYNQGLNKFSELVSKNKDSIDKLSQQVITFLVEYLDASIGCIFMINDENEADIHLVMTGSFGLVKENAEKKFLPGEGQVGICIKERRTLELTNYSENYLHINSGLGEARPKFIVLVPLSLDENVLGVIELASFNKLKGYKVLFLEKAAENLASILNTMKANSRLTKMIEQFKMQAEEMSAQEEEMRQNMEEMQATQEEAARREDELITIAEEAATREELLNQKLEDLKNKNEELTKYIEKLEGKKTKSK